MDQASDAAAARRAAAWLEGLLDVERMPDRRAARLELRPVRALLDRLGNPERALPVLHVAGSKGKGSTALLAEALLRAAGRRVATFTSPHLERWTERFRIDGQEVAGAALEAAVARLAPHVEALRAEDPTLTPTFFDATTAAAFLLFAEARVDVAVLEVGLGGRADSTNACVPRVSAIASIEREHVEVLGTSLAAIAGEKAGILRPGVPAVAGALPAEAATVVAERARELGTPLAWLGRDFGVRSAHADAAGLDLELFDGGARLHARLPLLGSHHAGNAALALACVRRLGLAAAELADAAPRGFARATLPGRCEVLQREPVLLVDSAHTPASARALAAALALLPQRAAHLVLSVSAGKDLPMLCAELAGVATTITLTRAEPRRSLDPRTLAAAMRAAAPAAALRVVPNPHLALRAARAGLAPDQLGVAAGSVYLAGLARTLWGAPEPAPVLVSRSAATPEPRP